MNNLFYYLWTGAHNHDTDKLYVAEELNKSLYSSALLESLPWIILQIYNNDTIYGSSAWTPFSIFSVLMSLSSAVLFRHVDVFSLTFN